MDFRDLQFRNTNLPKAVTLSGITIDFNPDCENVQSSSFVTLLEITALTKR